MSELLDSENIVTVTKNRTRQVANQAGWQFDCLQKHRCYENYPDDKNISPASLHSFGHAFIQDLSRILLGS
jgi:hypothetical protein